MNVKVQINGGAPVIVACDHPEERCRRTPAGTYPHTICLDCGEWFGEPESRVLRAIFKKLFPEDK